MLIYCSLEANTVQTVVEALIQAVPERCTRLLPVIEHMSRLAHDEAKQRQRACIADVDDKEQTSFMKDDDCDPWKSVEFILRITRSLSVSVSGAAEDVASLNWNELPLIPVTSELLAWSLVQGAFLFIHGCLVSKLHSNFRHSCAQSAY